MTAGEQAAKLVAEWKARIRAIVSPERGMTGEQAERLKAYYRGPIATTGKPRAVTAADYAKVYADGAPALREAVRRMDERGVNVMLYRCGDLSPDSRAVCGREPGHRGRHSTGADGSGEAWD